MRKTFIDETDKNNDSIEINIIFTLIVTISAILFDTTNFMAFIKGSPTTSKGAMEAFSFLLAWIVYGIVMGYRKEKNFVKFLSLYWGVGGLICLFGISAPAMGFVILAILTIPVMILNLSPTYGLGYYITFNSTYLFVIMCITFSWSSGAAGYMFGYLLNKLIRSFSTLSN